MKAVIFFVQDYRDRLDALSSELESTVSLHGAWVEHKDLLVAWHYRAVGKEHREALAAKALAIYEKHEFEVGESLKKV